MARKASRVIAIDTNDGKSEWATKFGATEFINPMKLGEGVSIVEHLVKITDGGLDYTLYGFQFPSSLFLAPVRAGVLTVVVDGGAVIVLGMFT